MKSKIKVGVIGVGHLGKHHVNHFSKIDDAKLIGVYDINSKTAKKVSKRYNTTPFRSLSELIEQVDAVSVVTPTREHVSTAEECLKSRKHVFIEKPITETVEEADMLINLAKENNAIIQVGHIERLNPALMPLADYDLNPKFVEVQRLAPYMIRGSDVPVVLDLMIHDIDLVLSLIPTRFVYNC